MSVIDVLYKYGRLNEYSEQLFSTGSIYFAPPGTLNDPFECRPWLTFNGTREQVIQTFERMFVHLHGQEPRQAAQSALEAYAKGAHANPENWLALRKDVIRVLGARIGLCCLSRVPDSILMWSHYAADHTGYCIEFQAEDETPVFGAAQPVAYSDSHPVIDFYNTPNLKQVELIFLTKYLGWAYEQEWRVVDHGEGPGVKDYPPDLMRSVTFGLRMPADKRKQVRDWVARRGHKVRFLQAVQDDQQFAIRVVDAADA